ncbi:related to thiamin pyrophosphokinase [Cephalotrichum gorgonifer]|uniref:Related to thiamin pyrophosphokinase n=1 Tax=Cephalotrichum gorgonifer TaxID=2041049 RepID=A0AAE8MUQ9_9PEZI|nr:related to thiamin pyrophosphokinase [Cephalotrichum gorgonifer]
MAAPAKTLLDLVEATDNIPLDFDFTTLYRLYLSDDPRPHGILTPSNVARLPWTPDFKINHSDRTVHLIDTSAGASPGPAFSASLQRIVDACLSQKIFPQLNGQHSEHFRVLGANYPVTLERYVSPLFGTVSLGAHMTAYVGSGRDMKIWVAKRSAKIFTYPGKLDTSVAGGVKAGDSPLECIVAESDEEASLDRDFVRQNVVATGMVSYMGNSRRNDTIQPVVLYVYDLQTPEDMILKPQDDEVESFTLMTVDEIFEAMLGGKFKTNCCAIMIDFFVRHGIVTEENEPNYLELITRLRRRLPVPLAPSKNTASS